MNNWKDITTAPKDGTSILACRDNGCGWDYYVVYWSNDDAEQEYPWESSDNAYPEDRLDYWMPLPEPPYTYNGEDL